MNSLTCLNYFGKNKQGYRNAGGLLKVSKAKTNIYSGMGFTQIIVTNEGLLRLKCNHTHVHKIY